MDGRLQSYLKEDKLNLDSKFSFKCERCGKCCRDRNDIILNPQGVFRLERF